MPLPRPSRLPELLLVGLALVVYWVMAVSVSPRMGVTADEVVHLTGGYSYWKFNDYRLHPENGTLPMRLAALPLLGLELKFPPLDDPEWVGSKVNIVGGKFFHELGNPLARMLQRGRAAIALLGVLTCWLVWRWARGLFGRVAGGVALMLAVFCPALLAHGGLITSDMAFTLGALAALSAVWLLLHRATWWRLLAATAACGACFLSKMSGGIIVPLIGLLLLLRWWRPAPFVLAFGGRVRWLRRRAATMAATLGLLVAVGAGSLVLLWANYSFRFDGFNRTLSTTTGYYFPWDVLLDRAPLPGAEPSALDPLAPGRRELRPEGGMVRLVGFLRDHRLLPEAYLWGLAHTYKFSKERPAFFLGEYRKTGWPLFFPVAFLMKTTLPALLLMAAGAAAVVGRRVRPAGQAGWPARRIPRALAYRAAPLLLFFTVYWLMAVTMSLNLGHRHILPVYPICYIFAGAAALWLAGRTARLLAVLLGLALAAHAVDSLAARPFYLSYFQPLTGGPARAYRYFVESSLDWGQGLPDLATWLERLRAGGDRAPVFLTYFGADSPRARQLPVIRFGDEITDSGQRFFPASVRGGWFVISATYFQRTALPMRATWGAAEEKLYRALRAKLEQPAAGPAARAGLLQTAKDYEIMQFARLCKYLEPREPLQLIGGSLLLHRLTDDEVQRALYGPVTAP
jgi:4-amino-4-deoxy-L-arabinose transferase-like glycosyltransferase